MSYKQLKRKIKIRESLLTHYKEMSQTAISELRFANLKEENLKNIIDEVKILLVQDTPNQLIKKVIDNGLERYQLDKLIHYNQIK
jgi:hypothetical protein